MTGARRRRADAVTVEVCPDGPLLVRGADTVVDAEGTAHEVTRPVVGVCTCGMTQRAPWCDNTHAFAQSNRGSRPAS